MTELKDRTVLVTGGGRGLGEAVCRTLAAEGARVVVADIRENLAAEVAKSLEGKGCKAMALALDVTDTGQIDTAIDRIGERFGPVDILINNAGIDVTESIEKIGQEDWDKVLMVNLRGPFVMAKRLFGMMRERGGGQIVNIVSTAAKRAWPNASAYHSSKWGLLGLSHAMHAEGRPHGIKVSAVVTGGMRTPFLLDRFPDIDVDTLQDPQNVADTIRFVLTRPPQTVIAEVMVLPMKETSWP